MKSHVKICTKCGEVITFVNNQDTKICPKCKEVVQRNK